LSREAQRATCAASKPVCRLTEAARRFKLTVRETEVLKLLGAGHAWKNAADALGISARTVEFHARNIQRKTLCPSCFAAAVKLLTA
jgi:DNA-binding NarL/FixJ family response regulator